MKLIVWLDLEQELAKQYWQLDAFIADQNSQMNYNAATDPTWRYDDEDVLQWEEDIKKLSQLKASIKAAIRETAIIEARPTGIDEVKG